MKTSSSTLLKCIFFCTLLSFFTNSYSQKKSYKYDGKLYSTAQEACNVWKNAGAVYDKDNPYSYNFPTATVIQGDDSTYCGCRRVGTNGNGETAVDEQLQLIYIEYDDTNQSSPGTLPKIGDELSVPYPTQPSTPNTLPKIGDELSVPYKDGRTRAKVLDTSGRFVTMLEKSKSASSDIKHLIPKETFRAQLESKEIIRWTEERARLMANRPPYKKGLVETVWNNAKRQDSSVYDPVEPFEKLEWVKGKSRYTQWHMGHVNDHQYSKLVDEFVDGKIDWDKFIDEYNKAENYAPELPIKNMRKGVNAELKPQK